ncbi:MAG: hypothetical protein ABW107_21015, partial [Candidatus Thiodiazotropha sp. 6PLUC5]
LSTELPNRLIHGVSLPYQVSFTDHGKKITKQEFLHMVNVSSSKKDIMGRSEARPFTDDGRDSDEKADDGIFTMTFGGEALQSGMGELIINARGATFIRERRITYQVVPPVELNLKPRDNGQLLDLQLIPDDKLIDPGTLKLEAWLEDETGTETPLNLQRSGSGASFTGVIDLMSFSGPRKVTLKAAARSVEGAIVDYIDTPVEVEGVKPFVAEPEPAPAPIPPPEPEPQPAAEAEPAVEAEPEETQTEEEDEGVDWVGAAIWFGVINLVLIALAGGIFWWMRRSNQGNKISLVDEPSGTDATDAEPEKES